MEAAVCQFIANPLISLEELASAKVNKAVTVTLEILNAMSSVAIEEQQLL
jgi:hypothetical protein